MIPFLNRKGVGWYLHNALARLTPVVMWKRSTATLQTIADVGNEALSFHEKPGQ